MGHLNVGTPRLVGQSHSLERGGSRVLRFSGSKGAWSLFRHPARTQRSNGPEPNAEIPKHARIRTDCLRMGVRQKCLQKLPYKLQNFGRPLEYSSLARTVKYAFWRMQELRNGGRTCQKG